MAQTGTNILSYQGNAALGSGSNPDIPVIAPNTNLDVINQTARDLSLMNHQTNIQLYRQKVQDRDETLRMLAAGQIASGKLMPNDRKIYDEAKKKAQDDFYKMIQNGGLNNPDAVRTYRDSVSNLKNVAAWGQSRDIELAKLMEERASKTLPEDIAAYDKHIKNQQSKDFWQPIDPFQKAFDYDIDKSTANILGQPITDTQLGTSDTGTPEETTRQNTVTDKNGVVTRTSTEKTKPIRSALVTNKAKDGVQLSGTQINPDGTFSEISYTPEKFWDFDIIRKNVSEQAASNPSERQAYQSYLNDFTDDRKLPIDQQLATLKSYNNRIADYSTQRGISPIGTDEKGNPVYPDQIKYYQDPISKKVLIQETPESFFAKHALASINGDYVQKPVAVLNEDAVKMNVLKQKANADEFYKHAMAGAANTKARAFADNLKQQMKLRGKESEQNDFLNDLYTKNTLTQKLLQGSGEGNLKIVDVPIDKSMPLFYFNGKTFEKLNGIGGETKTVPDYKTGRITTATVGGVYKPQVIFKGQPITSSEITQMYHTFKKNTGSKFKGDIHDFINGYINNGLIEVDYIGTDSKGNPVKTSREISNAALRAMTAKKGQTSVFNDDTQPPLDEQIPDNNE